MKNKHIKELILIATELDSRGLLKEASVLDKLAADIINFEERAEALRSKREPSEDEGEPVKPEGLGELVDLSERRGGGLRDDLGDYKDEEIESALEFIEINVSPESAVIFDGEGEADELANYAYNDSQELREYMTEVIPDKLYDLATDVKEPDMGEVLRLVKDVAESLPRYEDDEDFKYLTDAMFFYMSDYDF